MEGDACRQSGHGVQGTRQVDFELGVGLAFEFRSGARGAGGGGRAVAHGWLVLRAGIVADRRRVGASDGFPGGSVACVVV